MILREIIEQDGPDAVPGGLESSQMVALVAYLQRLGVDISRAAEEPSPLEVVMQQLELDRNERMVQHGH